MCQMPAIIKEAEQLVAGRLEERAHSFKLKIDNDSPSKAK